MERESFVITQNTLLEIFEKYQTKQWTQEKLSTIELLAILKWCNNSDALHSNILEWLYQCNDMEVSTNLPKQQGRTKELNDWYMMEDNYPKNKECILPSIGLPIHVPVHSFVHRSLVYSWWLGSDLMTSHNLLFNNMNDPIYVKPYDPASKLGDINMGEVYYLYYDSVKHLPNCIIVSLIMLIDKYGHLN